MRQESFVFRVINRLDRDTTGLLILAKHPLSACLLSSMLEKRQIHRTYLAAVHGNPAARSRSGVIREPIGRKEGSVIERCVDPLRGEPAVTCYEVLCYQPATDSSLVQLRLQTGRTHQIRVHMKALGYPLYGDFLYNPDYRYISRQSLHSFRLEFPHPITGKMLSFTAPLPADMAVFTEGAVPLDSDS